MEKSNGKDLGWWIILVMGICIAFFAILLIVRDVKNSSFRKDAFNFRKDAYNLFQETYIQIVKFGVTDACIYSLSLLDKDKYFEYSNRLYFLKEVLIPDQDWKSEKYGDNSAHMKFLSDLELDIYRYHSDANEGTLKPEILQMIQSKKEYQNILTIRELFKDLETAKINFLYNDWTDAECLKNFIRLGEIQNKLNQLRNENSNTANYKKE